jgi:hypothetical protein
MNHYLTRKLGHDFPDKLFILIFIAVNLNWNIYRLAQKIKYLCYHVYQHFHPDSSNSFDLTVPKNRK